MKTINKNDLLYLAGLIDGDGSIVAQLIRRSDYRFGFQIRVTVQISQLKKRRHHLEQLQTIIGDGIVRDRGSMSDYVLTETKSVFLFLKQLAPFLRIKKKQAYLVIQISEQLSLSKKSVFVFIELCQLADQVADLNDSKNRKINTEVVLNELKQRKLISK